MNQPAIKQVLANAPLLSVSYKSPELLDNLLRSLPEAVIITDANFYITGVNPAAEAIYGLPAADAMGKVLFEIMQFDIKNISLFDAISELLNKGSWEGEISFQRYDNYRMILNTKATVIKDEKGQLNAIVLVNRNITDEISAGRQLELAESKYKTVVESLSEGVTLINADGTIGTANKMAAEILGLSDDEIKGKKVASPSWKAIKEDGSVFNPEDFPAVKTLSTGMAYNNVMMGIHKPDGTLIWLSVNSRPIFKQGVEKPEAVVASFKDITDIKDAVEKMKESELLFRTFFDNSPAGCFVYDEDGYVVLGNPEFNQSTFFPDGTAGKHVTEIFEEEFAKKILERNKKFLENGKPLITTNEMKTQSGETISYLLNLNSITIPGRKKMIAGQAIDITEEKNAQEKLKQSELLFSAFVNNSQTACWIYDENGYVVLANDVYNNITNCPQGATGKHISEIFPEEFAEMLLRRNADFLKQNEPLISPNKLPQADGSIKHLVSYLYHINVPGKKTLIGGQAIDVTEEKRAEEKVHESETLFRTFMKNTAALAWVYDESGKLLYANHEFRERTGLNDTSIGKNIAEITTDPEVFSMVNHKINRILSGEKLIINEDTIKDKNGVTRNYLAYWFLHDLNDNRKLIGGQAIDITEKKNASEKLEKSDTLFRTFMNNSLASAWIYDEDNKLVFGNKLFLESKGITGDYKGRHVTSFATVEAAKKIIARNQRLLQSGQPMITVDNFKDLNGNNAYYLVYSFILPIDDSKRLIGGQAIDITDKKNAQEQVDKINERFTYAVNASSDAIWDLDLRTNEIYRSDNFSKISGYESHQVEPTLDWWYNKIHPDDRERIAQNTKMFIDQGVEQWQDEYRFLYADGTYRYLVDKGFNVFENGKPVRVIGAIQDITERKKLEAQLLNEQIQKQKQINKATIEAQERERGMISGELHDNVNQLLMSAKLHIGIAKNGGDNQNDLLDKASDYLLMAVEEIRALSRKLNTSVVEKVGLEKCIIDICQNLTMLNKVETEVAIEEGIIDKLNREQRLMVLRIVQEQTNNIIKYAAASEASVSLQTKNNQCRLCISDNGKGFDKTKEKVNGIGLINIFNRVDAYNGKVEIISSPGKGCTIDILFPFED